MIRVLLATLAIAMIPPIARADDVIVRLNVQSMPAPKPVLKYQLLPEVSALNPGNAAQNYLRCFLEQRAFFYGKESSGERDRYQTMPLADLPAEQLRNFGGSARRQADWAARLDSLNWQSLDRSLSGGTAIPSPELGPLQVLALALRVRFRGQVAGGHFDEAVSTAQTMFALARHLGEHPDELAAPLGMWVGHLTLVGLQEMVQQPDCPNLYWALTDLPSPLVDLRKGVQGGRTIATADLRPIRDDRPMTETEIESIVSHVSGLISYSREQSGYPPRSLRSRLSTRANDAARLSAARRRVIAAGSSEQTIKQFPSAQVILLDEKIAFEIEQDERIKLLGLPVWKIDPPAGSAERSRDEDGLFADRLPRIIKLRQTQARLEQEVALLRLVEALRLDSAHRAGKLAAALTECSVPIPDDPVTGRPFGYKPEGEAQLLGGKFRGDGSALEGVVHYEVILRK